VVGVLAAHAQEEPSAVSTELSLLLVSLAFRLKQTLSIGFPVSPLHSYVVVFRRMELQSLHPRARLPQLIFTLDVTESDNVTSALERLELGSSETDEDFSGWKFSCLHYS